MQELIGFIVLMAAGVIAAITKEFDSVMYGSVGVFALILLFLDWKGKKAKVKEKVVKEIKANNDKEPDPKSKGLTTGLFTNYQ